MYEIPCRQCKSKTEKSQTDQKKRASEIQYDKYEARIDKWRKMRGAN